MGATVQLKIDSASIDSIKRNYGTQIFRMAYDIANKARGNAPYVTGTLRNSIRVTEDRDGSVLVIAGGNFGGRKVPYAWKREQGPNKNPATEHYMENAAKTVLSGDYIQKYFGGIIK